MSFDVAASGTDVVIARNGKPVARLTTVVDQHEPYRLGLLKGKSGWLAEDFDSALPAEILAQFEGL